MYHKIIDLFDPFYSNKEIKKITGLNSFKYPQDLKKFGTGTLLVFPSFVWHRVNKVTSGIRKVLVGWTLGNQWS